MNILYVIITLDKSDYQFSKCIAFISTDYSHRSAVSRYNLSFRIF